MAQISREEISAITDWKFAEVNWSVLVSSNPVSEISQDSEGWRRAVNLSPWGRERGVRVGYWDGLVLNVGATETT